MATQIQTRRGTTTQHSSFTGASAELTVDTDKTTLVVHDGSTAGGVPLLRQDLNNLAANAVTTAMVANDAITYAKIQNVSATDKLLGRSSSGAGDVEEITCTAAGRALLDDADATAQRTTLGLGTLATQSGTFSGTSSGTNTGDQTITLTGDVTGSGTGSFAATVISGSTTTAGKLQLTDSTSSTSTTTAATPAAVKSAYDLANAALPKAGGTMTGDVVLSNQTDLRFGEATANGSNYVGFQAPSSIASDVLWTLPSTDGTAGYALATDGAGALSWTPSFKTKAITIESPTASEKIILFFTGIALTVSQIRSVIIGGTNVTFSIRYGTDVSAAGTEVVTSGIQTTNTTTGLSTTSFNSASIPADRFIWITTSAVTGTVTQLHVSVKF